MVRTPPNQARLAEHLGAALVSLLAAVLMTWPLALHAKDHVLKSAYYWDAYTNAMIMGGHVDAVLGRGPLSLYDNYFFAPLPRSIVFNENLFGLSLIYAPFYLATNNPILAYNLTLLVSLSLSAFLTYLLVRRLTGSGAAGLVAGVAFALSPYVTFEIGRIQLVATQWIPACFLMLHRAFEERRLRDVVGLWLCYLLQVGTCLYYAMFLIPLLLLAGTVLLCRGRSLRPLSIQLGVVGAMAAAIALVMMRPYFEARASFDLGRSLSFASSYDGKLGFFGHVHDTNLTLRALHHRSATPGAHEEIAFPGLVVLSLFLLSLGVAVGDAIRTAGLRWAARKATFWLVVALSAALASLLTHSMLLGAGLVVLAAWRDSRRGENGPFSGQRGLYLGMILLSIALFLGLSPLAWGGAPVRGLYYYLHTYFPGFDGIRKVSRQAIMTTFALVVASGFGSSWLLSRLARPWLRWVAASFLLCISLYELRTFPHPVEGLWAGASVPDVYRFLATLPPRDRIATVPQGEGRSRFQGDAGRMLHDYLALYHKHRIVTGQSSWIPPVSELVLGALRHLPDDGARRILTSVGTRHILVHGEDLGPSWRDLPQKLANLPDQYRPIYREGADSVFTLEGSGDEAGALYETPPLPEGARLVPAQEQTARATLRSELARYAIDGNPDTYWSSSRPQNRGQSFEVELSHAHRLIALEIDSHRGHVTHLPLSFRLSVSVGGQEWHTIIDQSELHLYRELVFSPRTFVLRIVLPEPTLADQVRITIAQPVPDHDFVIHELRAYESEES